MNTSTENKPPAIGSPTTKVPESWDMKAMSDENEHVLVPLNMENHSDEYMEVADKFWNTMDDVKGNIMAIKRVQNLELWQDFSM